MKTVMTYVKRDNSGALNADGSYPKEFSIFIIPPSDPKGNGTEQEESAAAPQKEAVAEATPVLQNTLSLCPFCEAEASLLDPSTRYHDVDEWTAICTQCGAKQGGDFKEDAIAAWNRRAPHPDVSRLDWLDSQRAPVTIDGETLLAYRWEMEGQHYGLRDAIDAEMEVSKNNER